MGDTVLRRWSSLGTTTGCLLDGTGVSERGRGEECEQQQPNGVMTTHRNVLLSV